MKAWHMLAICMADCFVAVACWQYVQGTDMLNTAKVQGDDVTLIETWNVYNGIWHECITGGCTFIGSHSDAYYDDNSTRGERYHVSYGSNSMSGQSKLTIREALLEDGGRYSFTREYTSDGIFIAEIIMLESDPVCSRNTSNDDTALEGDVIVMSCQVIYQGRWAPWMVWQQNGFNVTDVINETAVGARNVPGLAKYSVVIAADRRLDGTVYGMETLFGPTGINNTFNEDELWYPYIVEFHSFNVPNYTYTYEFQPLKVKHSDPPTNVTFHPDGPYSPGQRITCVAQGEPPPVITWRNEETGWILSNRPTIIIPPQLGDYEPGITYQCEATNTDLRGNLHTAVQHLTIDWSTDRNTSGKHIDWVVIVAALVPTVLLCFAVLSFAIWKRMKNKPGAQQPEAQLRDIPVTSGPATIEHNTHHEKDTNTHQVPCKFMSPCDSTPREVTHRRLMEFPGPKLSEEGEDDVIKRN